jgi:hypothetical protein
MADATVPKPVPEEIDKSFEEADDDTRGRGQKPRHSFICNRYWCSNRVADWLGSLTRIRGFRAIKGL